jgi:single-stranded-DNA-specific exonuclease
MAAGLTLYESSIDTFRRAINEYAAKGEKTVAEVKLDCKLNPVALSVDLAEEIKTLEPFGVGNPTPLLDSLTFSLMIGYHEPVIFCVSITVV